MLRDYTEDFFQATNSTWASWMSLLFLVLREDVNKGLQTTDKTPIPSSNDLQMVCPLKYPGVEAIGHAGKENNHIQVLSQGMKSMSELLPEIKGFRGVNILKRGP